MSQIDPKRKFGIPTADHSDFHQVIRREAEVSQLD